MKLQVFIIVFTLSFIQYATGQTKDEKEERINVSKFPETAQNIIKTLPKNCKRLKFYKETDGDKKSYEAKFKYNKQRFSLEFSKDGIIEDIEIITKLKKIQDSKANNIKAYFNNSFGKHKLLKIQKQYVFTTKTSAAQFVTNVLLENSKIAFNFEIIAEVKTENERNIREFTFNNAGEFLSSRVINPSSYEHVLY